MVRYIISVRIFFIMFFSSIAILSFAFSGDEDGFFRGNSQERTTDTIPKKKRLQRISVDDEYVQDSRVDMRAVEDAMREVERSMRKLKEELGQDYRKYVKDSYRKAIDEINWKEVKQAQQQAFAESQRFLRNNIFNKELMIQQQQLLADTKRQVELSKREIERGTKSLRLALNGDIDRQLQSARIQLKEANKKLEELNAFKADLENDGLIKQDEAYDIEIKDGDLYINGKKQKNKVAEKYKKKYPAYFEKGGQFKLNNNKERRRVNINDDGLI